MPQASETAVCVRAGTLPSAHQGLNQAGPCPPERGLQLRLRVVHGGAVRFLLGAFEAGCFPGSWYHLAQVSGQTPSAPSLYRRRRLHVLQCATIMLMAVGLGPPACSAC